MADSIFIGGADADGTGTPNVAQELLLKIANRHGLVAGATGTGKTVTLQILAQGFADAGVPVFCADVKGDLSGICMPGSKDHKLHEKFVERANKIGKKILMSGGGRCNFTNQLVEPSNFLSRNPHFCKSALQRYNQWEFISLVEQHGIAYEERKHSQLFCQDSAKQIVAMLEDECIQAGVEIRTQCELERLEALNETGNAARYRLHLQHSGRTQKLTCTTVVVATGALSVPTLGGSGIGYQLAEQFGLKLIPRQAGLVPFMFSDTMKPLCERLSGLALDIEVSCNGQSFSEAMLFTHRGISGPAILQISNYWAPGDEISIDLLPGIDALEWLLQAK